MDDETTKKLKLFHVSTTTVQYHHVKDVWFDWFRYKVGDGRRPYYADLIAEYDPEHENAICAEAIVEELFTEDEAKQLKAYLDEIHGDCSETTITEHSRLIHVNEIGLGAIPCGGGQDCYMLSKERWYNLPFQVLGYFDLRGRDKIDGSGAYRGYHFVLDRDGMHKVENAPSDSGKGATS